MPSQNSSLTWASSRALVMELLSQLGSENKDLRERQHTSETDMARLSAAMAALGEQNKSLKAKYDKVIALCLSTFAVVIAGLVLHFARKVIE